MNFNKQDLFDCYCQKVLPLVYDDSLSYYEVLCKVIHKLNELIEINNTIRDDIHKEYVEMLEAVKTVTEAVASVTSARDEVLTLKQATEQYANDVVTVYNETVNARDTATQKAKEASTSAGIASEQANIASQKAEEVSENVQTASQKAEEASTSAQTATQKANEASSNAQIATNQANNASGSARVATEKAQEAKASADLAKTMLFDGAGAHNAIYRGAFLGNEVTNAQHSAIVKGTFENLYVGDYWTIDNINYRIAGFDYYLNTGDTLFTTHHAVIVPDTNLYHYVMNVTNSTADGYAKSKMRLQGLDQAKSIILKAFPTRVITHRVYLINSVQDGVAFNGGWYDSIIEIMCEQMVYGSGIFSPVSNGSTVPNNRRVEKTQLPLFQHNPSKLSNGDTWWLRDVISNSSYTTVDFHGLAYAGGANTEFGVRPCFCII